MKRTVPGSACAELVTVFSEKGDLIVHESFDDSKPYGTCRMRSLSLLVLIASGSHLVACSKGDSQQGQWPDPDFSQLDQSTEPGSGSDESPETAPSESGEQDEPSSEPEPDQDSQESSTSKGEESEDSSSSSQEGESSKDQGSDSTSSQETSSSTQPEPTSSDATSSTADATTSTSSEETSSSDDASTEPAPCELELCVRMNDTQPAGSIPWVPGLNMFSFQLPRTHRRLARIELLEGYGRGQTRASIRMDAGTSSAAVIARLEWSVNLPSTQKWLGANLSKPYDMQGFDKFWVVLGENLPSGRASVANAGSVYSIWHKKPGASSWSESGVALMFRAYCCKE